MFNFPVKTRFISVAVPASALLKGIPLGQGKCVGVTVYLNTFVFNTQTLASTPANQGVLYLGDATQQRMEVIRGQQQPNIIFANDLSEIYIRGVGVANELQVIVYERVD